MSQQFPITNIYIILYDFHIEKKHNLNTSGKFIVTLIADLSTCCKSQVSATYVFLIPTIVVERQVLGQSYLSKDISLEFFGPATYLSNRICKSIATIRSVFLFVFLFVYFIQIFNIPNCEHYLNGEIITGQTNS